MVIENMKNRLSMIFDHKAIKRIYCREMNYVRAGISNIFKLVFIATVS